MEGQMTTSGNRGGRRPVPIVDEQGSTCAPFVTMLAANEFQSGRSGMELAERLYRDGSDVLAASSSPRVRKRGVEGALDPLVWESVLLGVHFLCVVHALHERDVFKRLADSWHKIVKQPHGPDIERLQRETSDALTKLEGQLCDGVIKPFESQIDAARRAVHEILIGYVGAAGFPPSAASEIVSRVVSTLDEYAKPPQE
jgi:hypothetical protein